MQDFSYLVGSIDVKMIEEVISLDNVKEEDKKTLIAFSIARKLENTHIYFPKKAHRIEYAKILLRHGFSTQSIRTLAELSKVTVLRHKKEVNNDNNR